MCVSEVPDHAGHGRNRETLRLPESDRAGVGLVRDKLDGLDAVPRERRLDEGAADATPAMRRRDEEVEEPQHATPRRG